ncbi:MAG: transposase [Thermoanaerobaculia bacterium]|jgi:REP element-mobilizing transposase RayT
MFDEGFLDRSKAYWVRRGALPHWRQDGALYFVTFRLADSIPASSLELLRAERDEWLACHEEPLSESDLEEYSRRFVGQLERWLDAGHGSCLLRSEQAKEIVEQALRHFDGTRYELGEHVVAPNHVHALVKTSLNVDLSEIEQSWKSYTSKELLKLDFVRAAFPSRRVWHAESFDHIVRNRERLEKYEAYIRNHRERSVERA